MTVVHASEADAPVDPPLHLIVVPAGRDDDLRPSSDGCLRVRHLEWPPAGTDSRIAHVEEIVSREVRSASGVVVDVRNLEPHDALALIECAWHAGGLTILRPRPTRLAAEGELLLQAAMLADVVVMAGGAATATQLAPARVVEAFEQDAVLRLIGRAAPPKTSMTLSVLITTFNRLRELDACLESLTRQTLHTEAFEVIVVDDASSDDVAPVVERYADRLRMRLVPLSVNSGIGAARAVGVGVATGDVVVLLDDDDVTTPRHLAEHLRVHHDMPGEDVVVLGHTAVQPNGRADVLSRHVTHVGHQYFSYDLLRDGDRRTWEWFWGGRSSAKRSLMDRVAFRGNFMEDADWAERADRDLRSSGRRLQVVYARRAVQIACGTLPLTAMRRRQTKMALASAAFRQATGHDLTRHLPDGPGVVAARHALPPSVRSELDGLVSTPLSEVSAGPWAVRARRLARLDHLILTELAAHHALGLLAAERFSRIQSQGAVPTVSVDGGGPAALETATATQPGDRVRIVVCLDPDGRTPEEVIAALEADLALGGRTVQDLGDVELRVTPLRAHELADADFVMPPRPDHAAFPDGPLSLFGLHPAEWVTWLSLSGRSAGALR